MKVFAIVNNVGIKINTDVNAKNWLKKKYVIKNLRGTLECECDKSSDVGEYLDYANSKV